MAEPFLSEVRIFSFSFAPQGWAQCNGQFLPINQNQALFSLLGTTYGGNGHNNFCIAQFAGPGTHACGKRLYFGTTGWRRGAYTYCQRNARTYPPGKGQCQWAYCNTTDQ